jgi:hypothetical protein
MPAPPDDGLLRPGEGPAATSRRRGGRTVALAVLAALLPLVLAACSSFTLLSFDTPRADGGPDRRASLGSLVILDGSGSRDPDGEPITYQWSVAARPAGSTAVLLDNQSVSPRFTADREGVYRIHLIVRDLSLNASPEDEVVVTVLPGISRLPDTGQDNAYGASTVIPFPAPGTAYFGQDGQYVTNPIRLVDNGATVHDAVTGLDWQKGDNTASFNGYQAGGTVIGTFNPSPGTDVCGALSARSFGGFTDWRLPTRHELASIAAYSGASPSLPAASFPGAAATGYWSSTRSPSAGGPFGWIVEFDNGAVLQSPLSELHRVRCVRGERRDGTFTANGDGTVTDNATGLVWQQAAQPGRSWAAALAYCEGLLLGGTGNAYDDWRLPNAKELESLVTTVDNATASFPASDPVLGAAPWRFWSSTSRVEGATADNAWTVNFDDGTMDGADSPKGSTAPYVRCVR